MEGGAGEDQTLVFAAHGAIPANVDTAADTLMLKSVRGPVSPRNSSLLSTAAVAVALLNAHQTTSSSTPYLAARSRLTPRNTVSSTGSSRWRPVRNSLR